MIVCERFLQVILMKIQQADELIVKQLLKVLLLQ